MSTYQARAAAGLCPRCGSRPPAPDLAACAKCLKRARVRHARLRADGQCPGCGLTHRGKHARCFDCRRRHAALMASTRMSRARIPPDPRAADQLADEVLP